MTIEKSSFTGQPVGGDFVPPENLALAATLNVNSYDDNTGVYACKRIVDINCYMHWHDVLEVELFIDGAGTLQVNDRVYKIRPGLINFVNYRDFHEIILEKPITLYHVHFENVALESRLLSRLLEDELFVCYLGGYEMSAVTGLMDALCSGQDISEERRQPYMTGILQAMIIRFLSAYGRSPAAGEQVYSAAAGRKLPSSDFRGEKRFREIQGAIQYINMHFSERITLSDISRLFYMQEQYFSAKFHEIAGVTFTEYLRNLRLEYAVGLLRHSDHSVKQIVSESGYGSYSSFMRDFSRYFGSPPLEFRRDGTRADGVKLKTKPDGRHDLRTITPAGK